MSTGKLRERGWAVAWDPWKDLDTLLGTAGVAWDPWNGKDILLGAGVAWDLPREVDTGGGPLHGLGLGLWNGKDPYPQ